MTYSTRIEDLALSVRARNGLIQDGVETVGQLITRSPAELSRIPNFGKVSLAEVMDKVEELGLHLDIQFISSSNLDWDY